MLTFGGTSVLCANSPWSVSHFDRFDYIGSPWGAVDGRGGEGGVSLRNRQKMLQALQSVSVEDALRIGNGNEDQFFVKSLIKNGGSVPSAAETAVFGMSGGTAIGEPFAAMGTLADLDDTQRQFYLDYCPELKMFFPSLHNSACFGASPDPTSCFEFLCQQGGLQCTRSGERTFPTRNKQKLVTLTLNVTDVVN